MLKKYVSIVILGLLTVIPTSGLYWGYTPEGSSVTNLAPALVVGATANDEPYPSPYTANYIVPSNAETNFRIAHKWNGIFIPSMDVTSLLAVPAADSSSSTDINFRIAHKWNGIFIPSMDVTSLLALPAADSSSNTDVNFRIAHKWNGIFIPSMDVTGSLGGARQ